MCLAIPKKIVKVINKQKALAAFNNKIEEIDISLIVVRLGAYVLTHGAVAFKVLPKREARQILDLIFNNTVKVKT